MKVGLMGDNGFRAGHVNGNAAAAPALATAEVFGQAAKIGRAVDDLGQDLMHKENVLRDDESFRMGLTNARGLIASAEQDIDNGADWEETLAKKRELVDEPEFMTPDAAVRYRAAIEDLFQRGGEALQDRQRRASAKRARAAFSADWAAAVESGDMERVQSVLNSGVGVYVDGMKASRMLASAKKQIGTLKAAKDFDENPDQLAADLIDGKYQGVLSNTAIASYGRLLQGQSGVPTTVSLYDVTGMPLGEGGRKLYDRVLLDEPFEDAGEGGGMVEREGVHEQAGSVANGFSSSGGIKKKKPEFRSGVADPVVDLMRIRAAEGQLPTTEEIGVTSMNEVLAADVSGLVKDGGVGSPSYMMYLGELKRRWKEHGVSNDFQEAMESTLENRIAAMTALDGERIVFDADEVIKAMEGMGEFVSAETFNAQKWHRKKLQEFEIDKASGTGEWAGKTGRKVKAEEKEKLARRESYLKLDVEQCHKEAEIQNKRNAMEMRRWAVEWQALHPKERNTVKFLQAMQNKMRHLTGRDASTLDLMRMEHKRNMEQGQGERGVAFPAPFAQDASMLTDEKRMENAQNALADLRKKALALPKPDERLSVRTKAMNIPVADVRDAHVKEVWNDECFIVGEDHLSRYPQLREQYVPDVSFELADGRIYRPQKVAVVPGRAFGFSRRAAIALRLVPGCRFKAAVRFDFPDAERAKHEGRGKLFSK